MVSNGLKNVVSDIDRFGCFVNDFCLFFFLKVQIIFVLHFVVSGLHLDDEIFFKQCGAAGCGEYYPDGVPGFIVHKALLFAIVPGLEVAEYGFVKVGG